MKRYTILLFFVFIFCSKPTIDKTMPEELIEKGLLVYTYYLEKIQLDSLNTPKEELLDSSLIKFDMDEKEFVKVIEYYRSHPLQFNNTLTEINDHLNTMGKQDQDYK